MLLFALFVSFLSIKVFVRIEYSCKMRSTVPVQQFVPPPLVQPQYVLPQNVIMQPAPIPYYAQFPAIPTNTGPNNNGNLIKSSSTSFVSCISFCFILLLVFLE